MRILRRFAPAAGAPALAMTIGNFDGAHLGHQQLLRQVCRSAEECAALPAVMTFEPHPLAVLRPHQPVARLSSRRRKLQLLQASGIQLLHVPRFTEAFSRLDAEDFAARLFGELNARCLIVGSNFRFGRGGRGDIALLQKHAARAGAEVTAAPLLMQNGRPVSSGRIRDCLARGAFDDAAALLGRRWQLEGRVIRGSGRGREWGFPTANIAAGGLPPLRGIFAACAYIGDARFAAAVSIGVNPTVSDAGKVHVEAHLLDFDGDLYHRRLRIEPLRKLRDEKKYPSVAALAAAIADDIAQTRALTA